MDIAFAMVRQRSRSYRSRCSIRCVRSCLCLVWNCAARHKTERRSMLTNCHATGTAIRSRGKCQHTGIGKAILPPVCCHACLHDQIITASHSTFNSTRRNKASVLGISCRGSTCSSTTTSLLYASYRAAFVSTLLVTTMAASQPYWAFPATACCTAESPTGLV